MKYKIQVTFFVVLTTYILILATGGYVSVYITYFFLPTLAILGVFAFGNFSSIHNKAKIVFLLTLILTIVTAVSVQYVGVYLIFIVAPILLISGIITLITKGNG